MTPRQAAEVIGCTTGHVRSLIKAGRINAVLVKSPMGWYYDISTHEVRRYANQTQGRGFPRGHKRNGPRGSQQV